MKDILFQLIFILVFTLVMVAIVIALSGCRVITPVVDAIFAPPASSTDSDNLVGSGKESLFNAVKSSNWLVTFSIIGMAAGVFAFVNGSKIGIPAIVASGSALFMALAVARFATWMAVCGFIGALAAVGVSILVKNRALKEVVGNVQEIKSTAKLDNVDLVFQDKIKETLANQTKATKKLIAKVKQKLS